MAAKVLPHQNQSHTIVGSREKKGDYFRTTAVELNNTSGGERGPNLRGRSEPGGAKRKITEGEVHVAGGASPRSPQEKKTFLS